MEVVKTMWPNWREGRRLTIHFSRSRPGSNVEAGADDAALVEASRELDYDLAGPVVVDDLEFPNVACWDYGSQ